MSPSIPFLSWCARWAILSSVQIGLTAAVASPKSSVSATTRNFLKSDKSEPRELFEIVGAGESALVVLSDPVTEAWRDAAREFEIEILSTNATDYRQQSHSTGSLSVSLAQSHTPIPLARFDQRTLNIRALPLKTGRHPQLIPIGLVEPESFVDEPSSDIYDSVLSVAAAFQAANNARAVWVPESLYKAAQDVQSQQEAAQKLMQDLIDWCFHRTGQLSSSELFLTSPGSSEARDRFRVNEDMHVSLDLYGNDVPDGATPQVELKMLDVFVRKALTAEKVAPGHTRLTTTVQLPDRHGVFTVSVRLRHVGTDFVDATKTISVTPPRHDEYPRFIPGAGPYYFGAASTSVAFILVCAFWLLQS